MVTFRTRGRRWWLGGVIAAALVASVAALLLRPMLEHAVRARIESAAVRHGMVARIGRVHVGAWPLLRLEGFDLDLGDGARLQADMIAATWPGRLRLAVHTANLVGPAGVTVSSPATTWDVAGIRRKKLQLTLAEPQAGLSIASGRMRWAARGTSRHMGLTSGVCSTCDATLTHCLMVASQTVAWIFAPAPMSSASTWTWAGVACASAWDNAADEPQLGDPTDVTMRFDGVWRRAEGTVEIPEVHATLAGAALSGSISLRDLDTNPRVDLELGVRNLDFAQLLASSGLPVPEKLGTVARRRP